MASSTKNSTTFDVIGAFDKSKVSVSNLLANAIDCVCVEVLRDTLHKLSTSPRYSGSRRDLFAYIPHLELQMLEESGSAAPDLDIAIIGDMSGLAPKKFKRGEEEVVNRKRSLHAKQTEQWQAGQPDYDCPGPGEESNGREDEVECKICGKTYYQSVAVVSVQLIARDTMVKHPRRKPSFLN